MRQTIVAIIHLIVAILGVGLAVAIMLFVFWVSSLVALVLP